MAVTAPDAETRVVLAAAFDPDFYAATYTDLPPGLEPLKHYHEAGWREARDAAPWFSAHFYLVDHPDLKRGKVDPFHHYLTVGRYQGREIRPSDHAVAYYCARDWSPEPFRFEAFSAAPQPATVRTPSDPGPMSGAQARVAVAAAFDAAYYAAANPDVAASGMDPLAHFMITGWLEGRDPTPRFSVRDYLDANPDVAAAGVNPFAHYLIAGRAEGRRPRHDLGFRYDVIAQLKPVSERIADAATAAAATPTGAVGDLEAALGSLGDLHITFSHDDYLAHAGGLQLCVRREAARFAAMGIDHLHLHPQAPWQAVRRADEPGPLGVMLNGVRLGVFAPHDVREALGWAAGEGGGARRSFAIHSLLGHEPDETADILAAAGLAEGFFWLHDFASLCAGFHLLRNDVADCGVPPADCAACRVCAYGRHRARHTGGHARLFERLALTVAAPSQTTLDFWRSHSDLPARASLVLPHATLRTRGEASTSAGGRPFRLAFLGVPTPLKGWPLFRDLAERLADDPRYAFHHLGARRDPATPAHFHEVVATPEQPQAMQAAAEALEIDAALIWPLCRETFSFTAYEAAAAGAAVITGPDSGNVAAFVASAGVGRVLDDEAALLAAFESGDIRALSRSQRAAKLSDLAYSGLTADLVAT